MLFYFEGNQKGHVDNISQSKKEYKQQELVYFIEKRYNGLILFVNHFNVYEMIFVKVPCY